VHAPIGLDIGAITPEEIAVAITAEMIAVRRHAQSAMPSMRYSARNDLQKELKTAEDTKDAENF
jgi:xanthine/CO dehydrogenase XdhC/CoxF family maturation factor